MSTRRSAAARIATSVVAVVGLLGGQLSAVAHEVLVEHVRCAEHGELVHVGDEAGGDALAFGVTRDAPPEASPHARHEHCGVTLAEAASALLARRSSLARNEAHRPLLAFAEITYATAPVHVLAPKTSPPSTLS